MLASAVTPAKPKTTHGLDHSLKLIDRRLMVFDGFWN